MLHYYKHTEFCSWQIINTEKHPLSIFVLNYAMLSLILYIWTKLVNFFYMFWTFLYWTHMQIHILHDVRHGNTIWRTHWRAKIWSYYERWLHFETCSGLQTTAFKYKIEARCTYIPHLEYRCAIGGAPGVQQVILARRDEPLASIGKPEWEDTGLVEVELVFIWLGDMQDLHIGTFHSHCQPFPSGTVTQREYLTGEIMLLQLSSLPQVPRAHRVIQATRPQLGAIRRDVNARGTISVALELSHQRLVV